ISVTAADSGVSAPPAYKQLRYDEDYRYLRDPSRSTEPTDFLKYIPFAKDGEWYLTLGGEIRERYEYFRNVNWGGGPQDSRGYLLERYMLHADAHFGEHLRVFTQLKSGLEE